MQLGRIKTSVTALHYIELFSQYGKSFLSLPSTRIRLSQKSILIRSHQSIGRVHDALMHEGKPLLFLPLPKKSPAPPDPSRRQPLRKFLLLTEGKRGFCLCLRRLGLPTEPMDPGNM